jgi:hypothetical protein
MKSRLNGVMSPFAEDAAATALEELQRYTQLAQRTVNSGALMHVVSNANIEICMSHVPSQRSSGSISPPYSRFAVTRAHLKCRLLPNVLLGQSIVRHAI